MKQKNKENKSRILIVDDTPIAIRMYLSALEASDYSFSVVKDGVNALEIFRKVKPDLIITDILMPGEINGHDLIKKIREEDTATPIVAISGMSSPHLSSQILKNGANDFLKKPFDFDVLRTKVDNLINAGSVQRELNYYKKLTNVLMEENKLLETKLERLASNGKGKPLEKITENYTNICGSIAHGLKSEFMHIGYSLKEIKENGGASPVIIEESRIIDRSLAYSQLILQRLLNYLNMGSVQMAPIDLIQVIKNTEDIAKPRLASNIQLHIEFPQELEQVKVSANNEQLMGVFLELIQNASHVLRQSGGKLEVGIEQKDDNVSIQIIDNGPGIPDSISQKLLTGQVSSKNGLGLGLYLCKVVISEFGGTIKFNSPSGQGTTWTITLPIVTKKEE